MDQSPHLGYKYMFSTLDLLIYCMSLEKPGWQVEATVYVINQTSDLFLAYVRKKGKVVKE